MTKKKEQPALLLREFKPRTRNQSEYIRSIAENQIILVSGPAGSGKSAIATHLGIEYLLYGKVKKLIITRPIIESGYRSMGSLPGTANEKIHPYLINIFEELNLAIGPQKVQSLLREGLIEIVPLAFMRGRNFHNAFVIADEMSNAVKSEIKLLLTRIGNNTKLVLTGDLKQSDLPLREQGAFKDVLVALNNIESIGIVKLYDQDIVRNPLISKILEKLN
jgi:phosphate starvation-inducible PhoH-like protein